MRLHGLEFARFLCRPLVDVIPWGLERQTFAQWMSLWQFMHLDLYAGHLSRSLKGCSPETSVIAFHSYRFLNVSFYGFNIKRSISDVGVSYVPAMSMASSRVSVAPFSRNLS